LNARLLIAVAVIGATGISGAAMARELNRDQDGKIAFVKIMSDNPVLSQADDVRLVEKKDTNADIASVAASLVAGPLKQLK